MTSNTTKPELTQPEPAAHLFDNWFDPIETGLRDRVREFIQAMFEGELEAALSRPRYARSVKPLSRSHRDRARSATRSCPTDSLDFRAQLHSRLQDRGAALACRRAL
jgi:putative transposase